MPFPVDEERVVAAEEALGRRLPDELRQRLMRDNGGEVEAVPSDEGAQRDELGHWDHETGRVQVVRVVWE